MPISPDLQQTLGDVSEYDGTMQVCVGVHKLRVCANVYNQKLINLRYIFFSVWGDFRNACSEMYKFKYEIHMRTFLKILMQYLFANTAIFVLISRQYVSSH